MRPIFKKWDKTCSGNYRPFSLTSVVCKLFEGLIRDGSCDHLNQNKLLSDCQFGFSKGRSCVTQLLITINDWMTELDDSIPVDAVYLDVRKAFDTVPHKRLMIKLKGYGITGNILEWIQDFLSRRHQYVNINGCKSEQSEVSSGVPQGSVLGPTLFVYHINDLPQTAHCDVTIFADDTKAYSAVYDDETRMKLQSDIDKLVQWTDEWLQFNSDKCKILHLGKNTKQYEYFIKHGSD